MSGRLLVRGGEVLTPAGRRTADVLVVDGAIAAVDPDLDVEGVEAIDAAGALVAPGLVDLQVNGGWGHDVTSDGMAMWEVGRRLVEHGVTSFCPTVITSPPDAVASAIVALGNEPDDHRGARPLGLHLEGPMIEPGRRGAHPLRHVVAPSADVIDGWSAEAGVAMVTLAPELPGAHDVIRTLVGRGVVVAAGHSAATVDETDAAVEAGVTHVTHLFNAMSRFEHRAPGLPGAALARPDLTAGLIVDGLHVHPAAVRTAWNAKGPDGICLVSDAAAGMGTEPGEHDLGGTRIVSGEGIRTEDGILAGSAISLHDAVLGLIRFTSCGIEEAIAAATSTPARVIGAHGRGRIEPGAIGDLVVLDDHLAVVATVVEGKVAWRS